MRAVKRERWGEGAIWLTIFVAVSKVPDKSLKNEHTGRLKTDKKGIKMLKINFFWEINYSMSIT